VSVKITRLRRPEEPSIDEEVAPSMLRRSPRPISRLCRQDSADAARSLIALSSPLARGDSSRLARSPATQASRPFWESEHLRFSRPSGARRLLQHTYQHVGAPNGRFALARVGGMPRYALQNRELAQTICSEPRAPSQSLLETGQDRVGRATREKDPRDAGAPPRM